jgi:acid phosphatase (class A)
MATHRRVTRTEQRRAPGLVGLGVAVVAGAVIGAGVMFALAPPPAPKVAAGDPGSGAIYANGGAQGYLAPGAVQAVRILPPPPAKGSPDAESDRRIFLNTRALQGSSRWALAQADADQSVAATLKDFSCALGVDLGPASAPATDALLERFAKDQAPVIETAKSAYDHRRPFLDSPGGLCVAKTDELIRSPDYPSGHATWGWAVGLLLAEAAPERADQLLARGRTYGESRVICGAHNASAVEAGRMVGAALISAAHASPSFRGDLERVKLELASLRRSGGPPDPAQCARESEALGRTAY